MHVNKKILVKFLTITLFKPIDSSIILESEIGLCMLIMLVQIVRLPFNEYFKFYLILFCTVLELIT